MRARRLKRSVFLVVLRLRNAALGLFFQSEVQRLMNRRRNISAYLLGDFGRRADVYKDEAGDKG
jgi:hypothetical protein